MTWAKAPAVRRETEMMKTSLYRAGQTRRVAAASNGAPVFTSRRRGGKFLACALACAALVAGSAAAVSAQRVYGVSARRTTVVATGSGVAVRSTTVVAGRPALPGGYIAVLPGGYRTVVVRGARYYTVGGIYYRASFYQGRTVYIRTNI
jgi:ferric-dicitrate binding protein FerR (iron transport regulator)